MHCALFEAGHCRSCTDLRVPYVAQLQAKQQRAMDQLALPALRWLPALASAEAGFRNKAKMAIGGTVDAPLLGLVPSAGRAG
jgi:23S rRNA (uracil747-C5)-methyltransferase